jgi:hypothetical protein
MVHLILDHNGDAIGWELKPVTEADQIIAGQIRDLQFFGFEDTCIKYNGIELLNESKGKQHGNLKSVAWLQKKYHNK